MITTSVVAAGRATICGAGDNDAAETDAARGDADDWAGACDVSCGLSVFGPSVAVGADAGGLSAAAASFADVPVAAGVAGAFASVDVAVGADTFAGAAGVSGIGAPGFAAAAAGCDWSPAASGSGADVTAGDAVDVAGTGDVVARVWGAVGVDAGVEVAWTDAGSSAAFDSGCTVGFAATGDCGAEAAGCADALAGPGFAGDADLAV